MDPLDRAHEMVAKFPENELARFSLGKGLFDRGDFTGAQLHLAHALTRRPDWMAVQILLGKCALELGDRAAAREAFVRARELAIAQHHEGPQAEMDALLADLPE